MKALHKAMVLSLIMVILTSTNVYAKDLEKLEKRLQYCEEIVTEVMQMPDKAIPKELLSKCAAVAVFPYVLKGGFFVGARYGKGVVIAHDPESGEWKAPAFFTLGGGSFGFQFGAQAIDLILVIMNKRGLEGLLKDNLTLGGDASVAAGPIGRDVALDTDLMFKASIFSYSRTKGFFAGVALKGGIIMPDKAANRIYYGGAVNVKEILLGNKIIPPASSHGLINALSKFSQ